MSALTTPQRPATPTSSAAQAPAAAAAGSPAPRSHALAPAAEPHNPHAPSERRALGGLKLIASLAFVAVLLPFHGAILWGVIVALLFTPLQRRLAVQLGDRPTPATLLTLVVVLLMLVLPFVLVMSSLAGEAAQVVQQVQSGQIDPTQWLRQLVEALPGGLTELLQRVGLGDFAALQRWLANGLTQASKLLASHAVSLGQDTLSFAVGLFVMLYLAFFLIRDGATIWRHIQARLPLQREHQDALAERLAAVVRATVKGNLMVAAVQGLLGGLAFWALGIRAPLLWAVLMGLLSLLPAVGAGLVWLPVAGYLLLTGQPWHGLALVAWGALVIGLIDNFLRPILVGKDARMPDYLVLLSTLGGIALFGINGFVIGPLAVGLFLTVWQLRAASPLRD